MNFLVISDIHGSSQSLKKVLLNFEGKYDYIICCGDYLNHGPRNPLPEGWNPKETADLLNGIKEKLICVRGNCDSEVDEMVLEFPCLQSYTNIFLGKCRIFVTHGHLFTKEKLESILPEKTLVVSGHTHISLIEKSEKLYFFNPGSISLPKCSNGKTCGLLKYYENSGNLSIQLYTLDGSLIEEKSL